MKTRLSPIAAACVPHRGSIPGEGCLRKVRLAVVGAVFLAAIALTASAAASPPAAASGGFTIDTFNSTFVKLADGNLFQREHDLGTFTGTFTGTTVFDGTVEGFKDGSTSVHGIITFNGTVAGCGTGSVVFEANAAIDTAGKFTKGHLQTLSGQGTLPVHASLDVLGTLPTLTYAGQHDC